MTPPVGRTTLLLLIGFAGGTTAALGEPPAEPIFPFVSRARPPAGDPFPLELRPASGTRFERSVRVTGVAGTRPEGGAEQVSPVAMTYRAEFTCDAVASDGQSSWAVRLLDIDLGAATGAPAGREAEPMRGVRGAFTLDRRGRLLRSTVEGGSPAARLAWQQTVFSPGGWPFLAYPEAPVRLGVPFGWAESFEPARVRAMLGVTDPAVELHLDAEAVPVRIHTRGGLRTLELELNLVVEAEHSASGGGGPPTVRSALRLRGMQHVALGTGLPVGTLDLTMDQSTIVRRGERTSEVRGLVQLLAEVSTGPTPTEAPPAPEAQRTVRAQLAQIAAAIDLYRMENKKLPSALVELTRTTDGSPEPHLARVPRDPWNGEFDYAVTGRTYRLRSPGPDGRLDTSDDVTHGG